jgi:putative ABC transport system ATP-binding protein
LIRPRRSVRDPVSLSIKNLTVEFTSGGYKIHPLNRFSFDGGDGELVVLLGPSGCGKTTLLSCLAGLLTPTSGSIRFNNEEITGLHGQALAAYRRQTVGVVFQAFNLIPSLSARSNVMVPLRLSGVPRKQARERATALLDRVGLAERAGHRPAHMSGGQQQRAAIARALVHDPPLVLADEPTAHLDYIQVEGILRLLRDLACPGRMVVVATHDERITQLADKVVELAPHLPAAQREPTEVMLDEGQFLFRQGDPSDLVYLIQSGEIEILREKVDGEEEHVTMIGSGGYFGELGPMLNLPRSASARAVRPTVLTGCSVQQFRALRPGKQAQGRTGRGEAVGSLPRWRHAGCPGGGGAEFGHAQVADRRAGSAIADHRQRHVTPRVGPPARPAEPEVAECAWYRAPGGEGAVVAQPPTHRHDQHVVGPTRVHHRDLLQSPR